MTAPTILITGAAGFIGMHVSQILLARGDQVMVLDDLSTGRHDNIRDHIGNPNFEFVLGSILNEALVDDAVRRADVVLHLAAAVGVEPVRRHAFDVGMFIGEFLGAGGGQHDVRRTLHHRVSDRVKQVCLPETSTAVKEERVVCAAWPLGDRLRCSVCKPARGTNDIRCECVSRVQVGWSRRLARINNAN